MPGDDTPPDRQPMSLDGILTLLDDGETLAAFYDEHRELIRALRAQAETFGKAKGGFTIKIDYTVDRRGQVEMTGTADTRLPKSPRGKAIAYVQGSSAIGSENPRQEKFAFAAAPVSRPEFRTVNHKED